MNNKSLMLAMILAIGSMFGCNSSSSNSDNSNSTAKAEVVYSAGELAKKYTASPDSFNNEFKDKEITVKGYAYISGSINVGDSATLSLTDNKEVKGDYFACRIDTKNPARVEELKKIKKGSIYSLTVKGKYFAKSVDPCQIIGAEEVPKGN